ncbi:50S ribosomal protein L3 [Candidatus Woesearchaeota archaeon CG_4_10_14_0_2_um_filter_33_13]|nr:MAG: 50S ribosomal protein L3 [Candidatus Woesearchaeota archaeon CG_4_10_14_0_2_um_filter_33_13]
MGNIHAPRRGSLQFWPRKRAKSSVARVRSWAADKKAKPLGFIGYKVGMTHLHVVDNRAKSLTKGEKIFMPVTIVECPTMSVMGVSFYKKSLLGWKKLGAVLAEKLDKTVGKAITMPKKVAAKKLEEYTDFEDLRLLVHSNPKTTSVGAKKPKLIEIALGGSKEDKINYAKAVFGKDIKINDVFENGNVLDVHGITKGKGFQGTVKRYGVPIRQHKAEKTKRGIGTLGSWTPKRVEFSVAQPGKMGYHLRTEHNKQVISIDNNIEAIAPKGGFARYGAVKNDYVLLKGSITGPKKRAVLMTNAIRINTKMTKEAPQVAHIHK